MTCLSKVKDKLSKVYERFLLEQKAVEDHRQALIDDLLRQRAETIKDLRRQAGEARAQVAGRQAEKKPSQAAGAGVPSEPESQGKGATTASSGKNTCEIPSRRLTCRCPIPCS
jgi:hypothetical protein